MREFKRKASLSYDSAVPLTGTSMDIVVHDGIMAAVTIESFFENRENSPISIFYVMPAAYGSAIYDMKITKDGVKSSAEYFDTEKAFDAFDNAQEKGNSSFLLEMIEDDSAAVSVGALRPGEEAAVSFKCALLSEIKDNTVSFRIPLSLSPRYAPLYADSLKADMLNPPAWKHVPYAARVRFSGSVPGAEKISSPSHELKISLNDDFTFSAESLGAGLDPDRDLVLEVVLANPPAALCLAGKHKNGTDAALFSVVPDFDGADDLKNPVFFVFDCSASMTGSSFDKAKEALELCVKSMETGTSFNILAYSDSSEFFSPSITNFDYTVMARALDYTASIKTGGGGSELLDALEKIRAMASKSETSAYNVVLISDGNSCGSRRILEYAAANLKNARFFTFGAGYAASHHLIKGLAEISGGAWEFIQPGADAMEKVIRQFSRMARPALKEMSFSGKSDSAANGKEEGYPVTSLYDGDGSFFLLSSEQFAAGGQFKLSCRAGKKKYSWACECRESAAGELIPVLWAGSVIRKLEMKKLVSSSADEYSELCEAIMEIGHLFNILVQDSSFCSVSKNNSKQLLVETPLYRRIPVMLTKDSAREPYAFYDSPGLASKTAGQRGSLCNVREKNTPYGEPSFNIKDLLDIQSEEGFFECNPLIISRFLKTTVPAYEGVLNFIVTDSVGRKKQDIVKNIVSTVIALDILEKNQKSGLFSSSMARARQWLGMTQLRHKFTDFVELLAIKHFKL